MSRSGSRTGVPKSNSRSSYRKKTSSSSLQNRANFSSARVLSDSSSSLQFKNDVSNDLERSKTFPAKSCWPSSMLSKRENVVGKSVSDGQGQLRVVCLIFWFI